MADARQAVSFAADGRKTIKALGGAAVPYRRNEWNELTITVQDNHLIHQPNGITVVDVTDDDARLAAKAGVLALQLHKGAPQQVEFKDLQLKRLPGLGAVASGAATGSGPSP